MQEEERLGLMSYVIEEFACCIQIMEIIMATGEYEKRVFRQWMDSDIANGIRM